MDSTGFTWILVKIFDELQYLTKLSKQYPRKPSINYLAPKPAVITSQLCLKAPK